MLSQEDLHLLCQLLVYLCPHQVSPLLHLGDEVFRKFRQLLLCRGRRPLQLLLPPLHLLASTLCVNLPGDDLKTPGDLFAIPLAGYVQADNSMLLMNMMLLQNAVKAEQSALLFTEGLQSAIGVLQAHA